MDREFLKTLWALRFEKMRKMEETAAWSYQELLDQCLVEWGHDSQPVKILSVLVREERGHEKLVERLIDILKTT